MQKTTKLRLLIWKVYQHLESVRPSPPTCQQVWNEIRHRHTKYDDNGIIQEVTYDTIYWATEYTDDSTFKRKSLDSTLSKLKKSAPC